MSAPTVPAELDLHAYLDGELDATRRGQVEAWLASDPAAAQRLRELRALDQRLKGTFEFVLEEPATRSLQDGVRMWSDASRRRWRLQAAVAAIMLVLGAALGFSARNLLEPRPEVASLASRAAGAHVVFSPEIRHPVEVAAVEEDHLVKWLTKRLGHPIKAPALAGQGYELIGGRLLADGNAPAAQFMYEDREGRRVTLFVRHDATAISSSFEFHSHGELSTFAWVESPLAFVLVGKIEREALRALARASYEQLQR